MATRLGYAGTLRPMLTLTAAEAGTAAVAEARARRTAVTSERMVSSGRILPLQTCPLNARSADFVDHIGRVLHELGFLAVPLERLLDEFLPHRIGRPHAVERAHRLVYRHAFVDHAMQEHERRAAQVHLAMDEHVAARVRLQDLAEET